METLEIWLGPTGDDGALTAGQMALRGFLVFCFALLVARLGSTRFMSRSSPMDLVLAIMLGSVLSRAITGQSAFFPTLLAGAVLVVLHSLFALLAAKTDFFGRWVKGSSSLLIEDGRRIRGALLSNQIGSGDLREALRLHGYGGRSIDEIKTARLERNGEISLVMQSETEEGPTKEEQQEEEEAREVSR